MEEYRGINRPLGRQSQEIAGAYRIGPTDKLLPQFGLRGLYTYTVFKFHPMLLERVSPALEMGRSFVCAEYQKSFAPLMLLWRGIGRFLVQNPATLSVRPGQHQQRVSAVLATVDD